MVSHCSLCLLRNIVKTVSTSEYFLSPPLPTSSMLLHLRRTLSKSPCDFHLELVSDNSVYLIKPDGINVHMCCPVPDKLSDLYYPTLAIAHCVLQNAKLFFFITSLLLKLGRLNLATNFYIINRRNIVCIRFHIQVFISAVCFFFNFVKILLQQFSDLFSFCFG